MNSAKLSLDTPDRADLFETIEDRYDRYEEEVGRKTKRDAYFENRKTWARN